MNKRTTEFSKKQLQCVFLIQRYLMALGYGGTQENPHRKLHAKYRPGLKWNLLLTEVMLEKAVLIKIIENSLIQRGNLQNKHGDFFATAKFTDSGKLDLDGAPHGQYTFTHAPDDPDKVSRVLILKCLSK